MRPLSWFFGATLLTPLALTGCGDPEPSTTSLIGSTGLTISTTATTIEGDTDEDGTDTATTQPEGNGDGDGDSTGDGDGDGDGDGGDGDGDAGDGDGDAGDGDGDGIGCSDGDSGVEPSDNDDWLAPGDDPQPHGGFVPDLDLPNSSECDVFMQDCMAGEKCVPYASGGGSWDANKCVPVMGDGMVGEACFYSGVVEATDDCDENSACWDVNDQGVGTCTAFCSGTPMAPICAAGTSCLQGNNGSIAFCVEGCNPITQECPMGEGCFWANDAFACVFTGGDIPTGESCGFINDCAAGNMCVSGESLPNCAGNNCCAAFCDLDCGMGVCAEPGTQCVPFFEMGQAPVGSADVGVCLSL